ncbi:MAG: signal peptidase I [Actinomycetaceae bacterium]
MNTTTAKNRELWGGVLKGVVTVLAVVAVLVAAAAFIVPRFLGWVPLTILSPSMEPAYSPGDVVVVDPDRDEPRVGDVITFQPESNDPTLITHRVIGVSIGDGGIVGVTTQGDNNDAPDEQVRIEQVQGTVVYGVPWVGHLTQPEVRPWLGGAAIAVVVWVVISSILGGRNKDGKDGPAEKPSGAPTDDAQDDGAEASPAAPAAPAPASPTAAPGRAATADEPEDDDVPRLDRAATRVVTT